MNKVILFAILGLLGIGVPVAYTAGPFTNKVEVGNCGAGDFVEGYSATGTRTCGTPAGGTPANPTATAGPTAVNGSATTYMRSDGAPAVQQGSAAQKGIVQVDGTTITASSGVISAATGASPANPTATASDTAVNGSATTFMRSDGAPAIQKGSAGQFGVVEVDGTTITATGGVISSVGAAGANPTASAGPTAVNGSATTFMRSDGAPAVQQGSAAQKGIVQVDGTTITASSGVISAVSTAPSAANPTATAGPTAVNGSAVTFMRSDGAPAVQKGSASQFGIVEVDGTTITASAGVISSVGAAGANPSATAGPTAVNGSATTFMRSDGAPAIQQGSAAQKGIVQVDGTTITASSGVISAAASGKSAAGIGWVAGTNPDKSIIFTADTASTITGIRGTVATAVGSTAAISVFKAPSGTACSSGTNLVSAAGTFDANGTANTNQTLSLAGSGAPSLSAGDRVCLSTSNGSNFAAGVGIGGITVTFTVP